MKKAIIKITTFRGISTNAIHYYGSLNYYDSDGYYNEKLKRPLTKDEIDKSPDRFYSYSEGDMTECFNTWNEVIEKGQELYNQLSIEVPLWVDGIPNTKSLPIAETLKPIDTRLRCSCCNKVFAPREGLYNLPSGALCVICYKKRYK